MGPRSGLDGRKISSPPGSDPGLSNPQSVAITTELPCPQKKKEKKKKKKRKMNKNNKKKTKKKKKKKKTTK